MGFPKDFSILATFRCSPKAESTLLTIYSDSGDDQISVRLAEKSVIFYYQDRTNSFKEGLIVSFDVDLTDDQ